MIVGEMVTMLGSTLIGGALKLWGMRQEQQKINSQLMLAAAGVQIKAHAAARAWNGTGVQWTRRILALMAFGAIIVWPLVVPYLDKTILVTHGWTEFHPGFWFLIEGKEAMTWKTVEGLVITPLHTNLVAAIAGLYFGGSLAGHNR